MKRGITTDRALKTSPGSAEIALDATTSALREFRYDVFLCHNREEKPIVKDIADALQLESGVLFFLDEYSIPASVEFLAFIQDEMRRSASCAIFLGPAGWGPTHLREARLALEINRERPEFRIIPVALPECREEGWAALFGGDQTPPFNWVRFSILVDADARTKLIEAVQGRFSPKAAGPEAVTPYFIRRQAALWESSKRTDSSLLLRGKLLQTAQAQAAANPMFVTIKAAPFLARSTEAESNRYRIRLGLAIIAFLVATGLAGVAWWQRDEAVKAAYTALARSLAATAPLSIGSNRNDERGALLARQAYLTDKAEGGTSKGLTTASLAEVLGTPYFSSAYRLPAGSVTDEVSATGAYVIAGQKHPIVIGPIITADGSRGRPVVTKMTEDVTAYTFDPVGDLVWVSSNTGELQIRDAADPKKVLQRFGSLGGSASVLRVSADRSHVIAVRGDHTLISFEVKSSKRIEWQLPVKARYLESSYDGGLLAVADDDR
jgi:hypothetical protein